VLLNLQSKFGLESSEGESNCWLRYCFIYCSGLFESKLFELNANLWCGYIASSILRRLLTFFVLRVVYGVAALVLKFIGEAVRYLTTLSISMAYSASTITNNICEAVVVMEIDRENWSAGDNQSQSKCFTTNHIWPKLVTIAGRRWLAEVILKYDSIIPTE
jgi:hypothetical protein